MIYHIANKNDWLNSVRSGEYITESFSKEGFIHCSPKHKLEESANNFFKGQTNLIILSIDESKVTSEIICEDLYNTGFQFPHIYGKLNVDAVLKVSDLKANEKGLFIIPKEI